MREKLSGSGKDEPIRGMRTFSKRRKGEAFQSLGGRRDKREYVLDGALPSEVKLLVSHRVGSEEWEDHISFGDCTVRIDGLNVQHTK